mmetsp:Transcript_33539/g.61490  ORF Transcript_33539/g.61490 Transcript_33539/m.61490 type:complete len:312 (-) Transcript_33539:91-1026(-)
MACLRVGLVSVLFVSFAAPATGFLTPASQRQTATSRSRQELHQEPPPASQVVELPDAAEVSSSSWLPVMLRGTLAMVSAFLVMAATGVSRPAIAEEAPASAAAAGASSVNIYFGQGCFWHVQHELVKKEVRSLGRGAGEITALTGYAGGTKASDRVCYHNLALAPDYSTLGHTEVVNVSVPEDKVGEFAKAMLDDADRYTFGRADPQDRGGEYRSAIGLPGGVDSPLYKQIEEANAGRLQLIPGKGDDPDTVGTKKIWVYDSNKFPFYQGEVYHQFHDDMLERYSEAYHQLKDTMLKSGKITKVGCPEVGF